MWGPHCVRMKRIDKQGIDNKAFNIEPTKGEKSGLDFKQKTSKSDKTNSEAITNVTNETNSEAITNVTNETNSEAITNVTNETNSEAITNVTNETNSEAITNVTNETNSEAITNVTNETKSEAITNVTNLINEQQEENLRIQYHNWKSQATSIKVIANIKATNYRKWLILVAAFCTTFLTSGFAFSMSILYVEWLNEFGRSNWETSLVQSVCTGMLFIGGLASGFAITKYGPLKCGIFGGMITAMGFALSYFATSILHLVLLSGLLPGMGFSICQISAYTIITHHFNGRSKILALSFVEIGPGVGSVIFPILLEILTTEYGWRGTLLLIGGTMLNLVVFSGTYQLPLDISKDHKDSLHKKSNPMESNFKNEISNKEIMYSISKQHTSHGRLLKVLGMLFLNKTYMLFTISMALSLATLNALLIFLIDCFQSNGISRTDAVLIYMYANIGNTIFRFCPGIIKQLPHMSVLFIAALSSLLGCISTAAFPIVGSSYILTLIAACVFRIGHASIVTLRTISPAKLIGKEHYSVGLGITMAAVGIVQTVAGPISGYIRDVTGNYDASFFCASTTLFVSSSLFVITMVYRYNQNRDKHHQVVLTVLPIEKL